MDIAEPGDERSDNLGPSPLPMVVLLTPLMIVALWCFSMAALSLTDSPTALRIATVLFLSILPSIALVGLASAVRARGHLISLRSDGIVDKRGFRKASFHRWRDLRSVELRPSGVLLCFVDDRLELATSTTYEWGRVLAESIRHGALFPRSASNHDLVWEHLERAFGATEGRGVDLSGWMRLQALLPSEYRYELHCTADGVIRKRGGVTVRYPWSTHFACVPIGYGWLVQTALGVYELPRAQAGAAIVAQVLQADLHHEGALWCRCDQGNEVETKDASHSEAGAP